MALVNWASYYRPSPSGNVQFYNAVIPLTAGDWTDIVMPSGNGLVMKVDWENDIDLLKVDGTTPTNTVTFWQSRSGKPDFYGFGQDIIQDSTGVYLRILDQSGGSQKVSVSIRVV